MLAQLIYTAKHFFKGHLVMLQLTVQGHITVIVREI